MNNYNRHLTITSQCCCHKVGRFEDSRFTKVVVEELEWPEQSHDSNPTEELWDELEC